MNRDDIIRAAQDVNTMRNENTVIKLQDNEVLRVTAEGEFIWHENADEMIESGDYSQHPSLRRVLKALRENKRLRDALKKYGQHRNDCAVTLGGYQCTCGFNQQEQPR